MIDSVSLLATSHFLVNIHQTPLCLFSPSFVGNLTAKRLEAMAGEDQITKRHRKQLLQETQNLTDAKKTVV